jgi:hypothetical protein
LERVIAALCCAIGFVRAGGLLDQVRGAVFRDELGSGSEVRLTGTCHYLGGDGAYSLSFDRDGRFLQAMKSPAGEAYGFDGKVTWKQDSSGAPIRIAFETEAESHALGELLSDSWLEKSRSNDVEEREDELRLLVGSQHLAVDVKVDPTTSLPKTATITTVAGLVTINLSNWHEAGGRLLPYHADMQRVGLIDSFDVHDSSIKNEIAESYQMPDWTPTDASFDAKLPAELECKRAVSGHMLVHPRLNGKDVGWFILDSGAEAMTLDPSVAKSLNLTKIGEAPETGVGGSLTASIWRADSLSLGPLTIKGIELVGFDLKPLSPFFGVPLAGIVGYDVFRRAAMEVRFSSPRVALYDPALYADQPTTWSPLLFDGGNSAVEAKAEGKPGWYRVDTGDDGSITFHYPYVLREKML